MVDREEIIRFVQEQLGFIPTPKTKFFWGTGVAGLDAWAFMQAFADHYSVDMEDVGKDFDYGGDEPDLGSALGYLWKRITFRPIPRTNHFTIDHLVEVANRRKWFEAPIEA